VVDVGEDVVVGGAVVVVGASLVESWEVDVSSAVVVAGRV
jgi:hypothetical protein